MLWSPSVAEPVMLVLVPVTRVLLPMVPVELRPLERPVQKKLLVLPARRPLGRVPVLPFPAEQGQRSRSAEPGQVLQLAPVAGAAVPVRVSAVVLRVLALPSLVELPEVVVAVRAVEGQASWEVAWVQACPRVDLVVLWVGHVSWIAVPRREDDREESLERHWLPSAAEQLREPERTL